jgi:hypothetical protein
MSYARRIDANQPAIVEALRKAGAQVQILSAVGFGCPDLLVAYRGVMVLMEIKDPSKPPSARKLTPAQVEFHKRWPVPVFVVLTVEDALRAIGAI